MDKISRKRGLQLVEEGIMSKEKFEELVQRGVIAGEKNMQTYTFPNTTMTAYKPNVIFKASKKKNANDVVTPELESLKRDWEQETQPIWDRLLKQYAEFNSKGQFSYI